MLFLSSEELKKGGQQTGSHLAAGLAFRKTHNY